MKGLIQDVLGTWFLRSQVKKSKERKAQFTSFENVKSIGVLLEQRPGLALPIDRVNETLSELGKKYKVLLYLGKDPKPQIELKHWVFFERKNSDLRLWPTRTEVSEFFKEDVDVLLDLTYSDKKQVLLNGHRVKAKFKAGRSDENRRSYLDFMLSLDKSKADETQLLKELLRYLQQIKSKG